MTQNKQLTFKTTSNSLDQFYTMGNTNCTEKINVKLINSTK